MPFSCVQCDKSFKDPCDLSRHVNADHRGQGDGPKRARTGPFECAECRRIFDSRKALTNHWRLHSGDFECHECGCSFTRKSDLARHFNLFRCRLQQENMSLVLECPRRLLLNLRSVASTPAVRLVV